MVARGFLVGVHRLRIELGREREDLLARDRTRAIMGDGADGEIFPMQERHAVDSLATNDHLVIPAAPLHLVMAGLVPAIHVF
jgi:hypothetical protein